LKHVVKLMGPERCPLGIKSEAPERKSCLRGQRERGILQRKRRNARLPPRCAKELNLKICGGEGEGGKCRRKVGWPRMVEGGVGVFGCCVGGLGSTLGCRSLYLTSRGENGPADKKP